MAYSSERGIKAGCLFFILIYWDTKYIHRPNTTK